MITQLSKNSFNEFIAKSNRLIVIKFYRDNCSHCNMFQKELESICEITDQEICFGNVDVGEEYEISDKYDIVSVPTLLYFINGEVKEQLVGYYSALVIQANIYKLEHLLRLDDE